MKKMMIASLVAFALVTGVASAECKCKAPTGQAQGSCCQTSQASKGGWFTAGTVAQGGGASGGASQKACNCSSKSQGQAPSGGSSEQKAGSCCQQQK